MEILITNDDGWGSKGILTLSRVLSSLGHVTVIAPDGPRSGMGCAITVAQPIYLRRLDDRQRGEALAGLPIDVYVTNGKPADCIKLAINAVFGGDDRKIDLVASGINHGHNAAVNLIYSGTMGACMVAAEHNIPAIGFSINDHSDNPDFSFMEPYIAELTKHLLSEGFQQGLCYNINAPQGAIQGIKWARQCKANWSKELEPHTDANGETYYILVGDFINHEPQAEDTDIWALEHNYISIQPVTIDMTAYAAL